MFVHSAEDLVFFLVISIIKVDYEAAVVSAIKSFLTLLLLAVIFILVSAFGDN